MHYPKEAIESKTEGNVFVKFVINEDGSISNAQVQHSIGAGCDEEAIRLVNATSGKWEPGKQNGIPVKVYFTLSLPFNLQVVK